MQSFSTFVCRYRMMLAVAVAFACTVAMAQQKTDIAGDFSGVLGPLHLKLHIAAGADGKLSGTLDSPDQGANGIPCADIKLDGQSLSFTVPAVSGSWKGTANGDTLKGTWTQGTPMPLDFMRDSTAAIAPFVPAEKPSPVDGVWLGALTPSLRLQLTVKSDRNGKEFCTADSLDQHVMGLECSNVVLAGSDFSFEIPSVRGKWKGKLSEDGKSLTGIWSQGSPLKLNFERQTAALAVKPIAYDPEMGPVEVADIQKVLDQDLAAVLKTGALAPGTNGGVSIGVVQHGVRKIFTYGTAKPESIFEIGSVSKTFTGLILSQMVLQGKVKFDDPVRELLPAGTVAKPDGSEITLLDLATQHSGLPRMPDNFHPADKNNPYADYRPADLYAFIAKQGVAKPTHPDFLYSNLGVGLLGQALANRAGVAYPEMLKAEVTEPLGLKDTVVQLSPEQMGRFIQGHDSKHQPVHAWDLDALAGAGAIRSTAGDMLTYLEANLHPEKVAAGATADGKTLSAALVQDHELHADIGPGGRIALAWLYKTAEGSYWHNGATGGYSSFVIFNPEKDFAVVVLLNTSIGGDSDFAGMLGTHITQRLTGQPAISLGGN